MQRVDQLLETRTAVNSAIRDSKLGYKTMGKTGEKSILGNKTIKDAFQKFPAPHSVLNTYLLGTYAAD